jgi:hypothetical protein
MQPKHSVFDRLKKVFSSNVIIRQVDGKLKVVDINNSQSFNELTTNYLKQGFLGLHSSLERMAYDEAAMMSVQRTMLFRDYELMDADPLITSALNVTADECVTKDEFGDILTIKCDNDKVRDTLRNLFYNILNIEFNLQPWIRTGLKYGDFFLKLEIAADYGIVNVVPISAYEMKRIENYDPKNSAAVQFWHEVPNKPKEVYESYEIAHFRLLSDTNFLPYGKSFIEPARRVWKQLQLMEDAMLIHRIMRAPEKRIFKIDVGAIPVGETDAYMQKVINKIKKVPFVDPKTGDYNLKYNMMNITEDFYLPVRGGDSGSSVESLSGLNFDAIQDIEYLMNKLLAALTVPKPFLGFTEAVAGKATMASLDVRFSHAISRIQKIYESELYKIALIHLFVQGFSDDEMASFTLSLTNPSSILEQEKISIWQEKTNLSRDLKDLNMFSSDWIYEKIWNMTDNEIATERTRILNDKKRAFRYSQIENEGNDPVKTRQSFGTSHDLAALQKGQNVDDKPLDFDDNNFIYQYGDEETMDHTVSDPSKQKKIDPSVKAIEPHPVPQLRSHYGQDSHIRGRDPLGMKDRSTTVGKQNWGFGESKDALNKFKLVKDGLKIFKTKTSDIIYESLSGIDNDEIIEPILDGNESGFLNENNLLAE